MDHSFFISRTSSTSSTSSHQHITISRKLHEISRRVQYAKRIIKEEGALIYGGCTDLRAGPPSFLRGPEKDKWIKDIRTCTNKCVWQYLLPAYSEKIEHYKNRIQTDIIDKITDDNRETIERGIQLGRDRANRKWDKREGLKKKVGETPIVGNFREEEIGLIKRGELQLKENEELVINNNIKSTKDIFKILAHGIYGSGRYKNLIAKSVGKYLRIHEEEEKVKFKPFLGKLSNNTNRWIHTWSMFYAFISNRDLLITTFELNIISRLYDVRIKIFRETEKDLECTWATDIQTGREVNILFKTDNVWSHLTKAQLKKTGLSKERIVEEGGIIGTMFMGSNNRRVLVRALRTLY